MSASWKKERMKERKKIKKTKPCKATIGYK